MHSCTLSLSKRAADILPLDKHLGLSLDECGWKRALVLQQPTLGLQMVAGVAAGITTESIAGHYAMTGDDDRHWVGSH